MADDLEMVVCLDGVPVEQADWATLADSEKPIEIRNATVWREGFGRKPLRMSPQTADMVAASAEARPVLYHHSPMHEEGVVRRASMKGHEGHRRMSADLTLDGAEARRSLARGVAPRFSIHPQPLDGATFACSECGKNWLAQGACLHPLTRGAQLLADGPWEMGEISRTPLPAIPGTGLTTALSDWGLDRFIPQVEALMSDSKPEAPAESQSVEVAEVARVRQLEAQLAELQARETAREAQLAVLQAEHERQQKARIHETVIQATRDGKLYRLAGDDKGLDKVEALAASIGLDAFNDLLAYIPPNPAMAAGGPRTPAPGPAPGDTPQPSYHEALADEMRTIAAAEPKLDADEISRRAVLQLAQAGMAPPTLH